MQAIRRLFIAGLAVWLPLWATYFVVKLLVEAMDKSLTLIPPSYQPATLLGFNIPGLGFIITLVVIGLTGLLATNILGKKLITLWEELFSRIPLVRTIYIAVKQVVQALAQPAGQSFRKVLLIEYPRRGVWSIGFQTSEQFSAAPTDEHVVTVFVPTTPNPTSGFLVVVPKKETHVLNISVEEALKMVISLGVVIPNSLTQPRSTPAQDP